MSELRIGSLCTGYGGLSMAVQAVLGGRVAWNSEYEPPTEKQPRPTQAAAQLLRYHHPDVPNLGDMTAIDWSTVEPVDVLEGGTPCTDISHAGRRLGMRAGTRSGIWASMVDAIDILRPGLVIWENVRGASYAEADSDVEPCPECLGDGSGPFLRALGRVLGDLADLRYDAVWVGLPASAVGAAHGRFRYFVAAYPHGSRWGAGGPTLGGGWAPADPDRRGPAVADPDRFGLAGRDEADRAWAASFGRTTPRRPVPDATGERWGEGWPRAEGQLRGPDVALGGPVAADPDRDGLARQQERDSDPPAGREVQPRDDADGRALVDWGRYRGAVERWEHLIGRPAPAPARPNRNGTPKLSAEFDEWLMGLPAGWVSDVPFISWNDQLKLCGNGVVPQQAAAAIRYLLGLL